MAGSNTKTITDENFNNEIGQSAGVALLDFWAPWCGPCKMISPTVDQIAEEYAGKVTVGKLDTDSNPQTASKFRVMSIPCLMIFKDGKIMDTITGAVPKDMIKERLDKALSV